MFPDEPLFEDPSIFFEQDMDDLPADNGAALEDNEVKGVKKWKRRIKENKINDESKKSLHRDIEKQRRQEMAALYASLRSLLPLEYVKGKRAVCDHMDQAVNYIKNTQKKIEEMKMRRNKLQKLSIAQSPNSNISCDCVKVNLLRDDGMEILITTGLLQEYCFLLPKVFAYLLALGLNVTTYVSTTGDHYSFHKLQIELNEITSIDISELKESLVNLIKVA